jgi:gliding motility-associated-like protein
MICPKGKIKIIKLVLLLLAFFTSIKGISQNDCVDAILICGNANLSGLTANGIGIQEITRDNACGSGENNSLWLKIKINTGGTLGFVLTPQSTDILEDLDFWIFGPNVSCSNLGTAIRCSTTNPLAINQPDNLTGMNSIETDVSEGPGYDGNSFIKWMDVLDNETYYIAIDRPTGVSAFSIAWSGTATFYQPPVPVTTNDLQRCSLPSLPGTAVFDLTPNINLAIGNQTNIITNFFTSYNDAVINTNPILNSNSYQNSTNPERIYLRLMNINTGCFAITDFNLSVALPSITQFSYTSPVCINGINPIVSTSPGFASGGIYSSTTGLQIDPITGTIDLALSIPGTYSVRYSLQANPAICQIATTSTFSITINTLPTIALQTPPQLYCINAVINPITFNIGGLATDVLISGGNLPLGLSGSFNNGIFTINGTPSETGTFNYTLTTVGGCSTPASFSGSLTVILNSVAGTISGVAPVCNGTNSSVLTLSVNSGAIQWQSSTDTIAFTTISNATGTTYTATNLTATTYFRAIITNNGCPSATTAPTTIIVNPLPIVSLPQDGYVCVDDAGNSIGSFRLSTNLSRTTNSFIWSNSSGIIPGQTGSSYLATAPGNYSVITTDNSTGCISERATATIAPSLPPLQVVATVSSYFSDIQTIAVSVLPNGIYEYKLDFNPYQDNNEFTNLSMGTHEIWVRDKLGCGVKKIVVQIINYPNYFTPNGDSFNDTWNITELRNQPNSYISIFDRYGKLIKQIKPSGPGWDGNYNGNPLPATDYWFTVYYVEQNKNEQFSSHFSLLR